MKVYFGAGKLIITVLTAILVNSGVDGHAHAQAEPAKVETKIEAFTITLNDNGREVKAPAEKVSPGGIIEYQLNYRNVSLEPLSEFVILGNVPGETTYHAALPLTETKAIFEVSVADVGWSTPPVIRYEDDGTGILRPVEVPKHEFEALRWRLAEPINPGEEVSATYRIKVEE